MLTPRPKRRSSSSSLSITNWNVDHHCCVLSSCLTATGEHCEAFILGTILERSNRWHGVANSMFTHQDSQIFVNERMKWKYWILCQLFHFVRRYRCMLKYLFILFKIPWWKHTISLQRSKTFCIIIKYVFCTSLLSALVFPNCQYQLLWADDVFCEKFSA